MEKGRKAIGEATGATNGRKAPPSTDNILREKTLLQLFEEAMKEQPREIEDALKKLPRSNQLGKINSSINETAQEGRELGNSTHADQKVNSLKKGQGQPTSVPSTQAENTKVTNTQDLQPSSNGNINGEWQEVISRKNKKLKAQREARQKVYLNTRESQHYHATALKQRRCFRCWGLGHIRAQCRDPARCYKCHNYGHLASRCSIKPTTTTVPTHTAPQIQTQPKPLPIQTKTYANAVRNKEQPTMAEPFLNERPDEEDIFLPAYTHPRPENAYLESAAWVTVLTGEQSPTLPMAIKRLFSRQFGAYPEFYKLNKADARNYLLVCANEHLRNAIVERRTYEVPTHDVLLGLEKWEPTSGMAFNPPGYEAWIQLSGVPQFLLNKEDLQKLVVRIGTVKYTMPFGLQAGQLERVTMLVASKHPRRVSKYLKVHVGDYAKRVRVKMLGWRLQQPGYFPPPQPPNGTQPPHTYPAQPSYNYPNMTDQVYPPGNEESGRGSSYASNYPTWARTAKPGIKVAGKKKPIWVPKKKSEITERVTMQGEQQLVLPQMEKSMAEYKVATLKATCTSRSIVIMGSGAAGLVQIRLGEQVMATLTRQPTKEATQYKGLIKINWAAVTVNLFSLLQDIVFSKSDNTVKLYGGAVCIKNALRRQNLKLIQKPSHQSMENEEEWQSQAQSEAHEVNRDDAPPGFPTKGKYNSPQQANSGPIRKSARLTSKNNGPYISAMGRALKLKAGSTVPGSASKKRKTVFAKPDPEYLKGLDPLSASQAEIVVATAGITMDEAMENKIKLVATVGNTQPEARNSAEPAAVASA